jgi:hypothetical protein
MRAGSNFASAGKRPTLLTVSNVPARAFCGTDRSADRMFRC